MSVRLGDKGGTFAVQLFETSPNCSWSGFSAPCRRLWNRLCILLSLLIHSVMLATWKPKAAVGQIVLPMELTELPPEIYEYYIVVVLLCRL